jgi:excinuclease ABC subunit A
MPESGYKPAIAPLKYSLAAHPAKDSIVIRGARQNNLKNLDLEFPANELIVVTGVSGSGKSSLVFDTLYAEGQRRYVETFSPYARQFLDRMDKPQVDAIEGIPPAIAIDQTNPVRTSRSTVGTMTELNDHLKLLYARGAQLYCLGCGVPVRRDTAETIADDMAARAHAAGNPRLIVTFPVSVPKNFSETEVKALLEQQGYTRIHAKHGTTIEVVQDRFRMESVERSRVVEALEAALRVGQGRVNVYPLAEETETHPLPLPDPSPEGEGTKLSSPLRGEVGRGVGLRLPPPASRLTNDRASHLPQSWKFSSDFHCAECDIHYQEPTPSLFSFNSPLGACESCRGFGRVIGLDFGLVVPDESKTLRMGAVKPWQTASGKECQDDLVTYALKRAIPLDTPWRELTPAQREWVLHGEPEWKSWRKSWPGVWYGVARYFEWMETKAYKMHVRVLLSKYRAYTACTTCGGARLKPEALAWRLGTRDNADAVLAPERRFMPDAAKLGRAGLERLPGLTVHDLMLLPISRTRTFVDALALPKPLDDATDLLLKEICTRVSYLCEVGLSYLTLDRQSRTLSGGEVQRINLTTALGTSLVNTLFVLDEPSIGLHPRDMGRVVDVMHKLRDAGNSLVVVEHDPQVMLAADRILDMGPGPGERGGEIVYYGAASDIRSAPQSLTGDYLAGRRHVDERTSTSFRTRASAGDPEPIVEPLNVNMDSGVRQNDAFARSASIEITGASEHNLKSVDVSIPLNRLVCVTGVSGSGKSTLIQDVLYAALMKAKGKPTEAPGAHDSMTGAALVGDVVMVDQSPIGRTARSNPASYVGAFDAIRKLFVQEPLAKERKYTAGTFSFNSGNGRCPTCSGNGFEHVEMQFLSDVYLRCADCNGTRYRNEILEVKVAGRSIADVLELTVSEALEQFAGNREIQRVLRPLADVGLEYLKLGQPVPTLSGGEAQRLKLAGHLAEAALWPNARAPKLPVGLFRRAPGSRITELVAAPVVPAASGKLFLFDEPTTGLHFEDISKLLKALRKLIAAGHSLIVIEHNLDVIRASDWVIDLGPEGGDAGGEIVATGTPAQVMDVTASHTGKALREYEVALRAPLSPPRPLAASRLSPHAGRGSRVEDVSQPYGNSLAVAHPLAPAGGEGWGEGKRRSNNICVHNAREHNLKNVHVEIPRGKFTVITGVSGSGKSTLAFDILFNEGQRRYLESLNAYARQFVQSAARPDVDAIYGIPPTVAIEQRTSRGGRKSTVATLTEIYHFLRLLYVKLGTQYCPDCDVPIEPQTVDSIVANVMRDYRNERVGFLAPLIINRKGLYTDLAKWAAGKGYTHLRVDGAFVPTRPFPKLARFIEHTIELPVAEVQVTPENEKTLRECLEAALTHGKGVVHIMDGLDSLERAVNMKDPSLVNMSESVYSVNRACPSCSRSFPELDPRLFSFNSKHGWCAACYGTGLKIDEVNFDEERQKSGTEDHVLDSWLEWLEIDEVCAECEGQRLNRQARAVRYREHSIGALTGMPVQKLHRFFENVAMAGREAEIARDIVPELRSRLSFLEHVGLGYLALDRAAPTLSGGEAQRIRLAAQLGSNLRGVCYILDEPTIGLHPRDNRILLDTLDALQAKGNTLIVVEHDEETIRRAAHVIDLGPGAGKRGGEVIAEGHADDLVRNPQSITGRFLANPLKHPLHPPREVVRGAPSIEVVGATLHNLNKIDVRVPLGRLVVVTGVSGSGKSTFARDVLHDNLAKLVNDARTRKDKAPLIGCRAIEGWEAIGRVLEVDQTPIGKTPRSCPATYVGFWDNVRRLFAEVPEARMRGYTASRFSFNTSGGRCEACEGQGVKRIEMSFLPDVRVPCEVCRGQRFNAETLAVQFKGKSIGEVLLMNIDEAVEFFAAHRSIHHCLRLMQDVGLGYLTLGQQSPTLSGGEAQRIKLVSELSKVRADLNDAGERPGRAGINKHTLYVLDEPTVGLHMADVEKLIHVLHRLVDAGNSVVVIEHNLDVIAEADWLIDLGPEGGDGGGRIVAEGSPWQIIRAPKESHTARILAEFLADRTATGSR